METINKLKIAGILFMVFLMAGLFILAPFSNVDNSIPVFEVDRFFIDYYDIAEAFYARSAWIADGSFPYDQFQEYPQVGLLYISLPRLFSSSPDIYLLFYLILAALTYGVFIYVFYKILRKLKLERWRLWFILLPSFFFFALSRFDVFASLLVLLAIYALIEKRFRLSIIMLVLSVFAKWYALLLLPIFLAFISHSVERKKIRNLLGWFIGLSGAIMLVTIVMSGAADAFRPYALHISRGIQNGGILWLIASMMLTSFSSTYVWVVLGFLTKGFFLIQMLPLIMGTLLFDSFKKHITTIQGVIQASALAVLIFVLFGKFYSPQWEIWWLPLVLLAARNKKEFAIIIVADILNYIQYPFLLHFVGYYTQIYAFVVLSRSALLLWLIFILGQQIFLKVRQHKSVVST